MSTTIDNIEDITFDELDEPTPSLEQIAQEADAVLQRTQLLDQEVSDYYSKIYQDGQLVSIHVSQWSMEVKLSAADLGIENDVPAFMQLGKKLLVKPEVKNSFKRIEGAARAYLMRQAMKFPAADAHFVPKKRLFEVLTVIIGYKREFDELVEKFCSDYETHREDMLNSYPEYRERLEPHYPPVEHVREKFKFTYGLFTIKLPEVTETDIEDIIEKEKIKGDAKAEFLSILQNDLSHQKQQLFDFVETVSLTLRHRLIEVCNHVTRKIAKGELVSKANINAIRKQIADFRELNLADDTALTAQIASIERFIDTNNTDAFKTDTELLSQLTSELNELETAARDLTNIEDDRNNYFRAIG